MTTAVLTEQLEDARVRAQVDDLCEATDAFRAFQTADGVPAAQRSRAAEALQRAAVALGALAESGVAGRELADAFAADAREWTSDGLGPRPAFDRTVAAYRPPADGEATVFAGPTTTPNGPPPRAFRLECFWALREEPRELEPTLALLPHPKNICQSTRLLRGSAGLMTGNCIVFFPENVSTAEKPTSQHFALFFFNKFFRIYHADTLDRVGRVTTLGDLASAALPSRECYSARSAWGYLHDYFHHLGPRPLDRNLTLKMDFWVGLLEELKVDCQSALAAQAHGLPFADELVEFILLERLFRYPFQPDALRNFDSATGFFLAAWLSARGAGLAPAGDGRRVRVSLGEILDAVPALVEEIEAIERIEADEQYRAAAVEYARSLVPEGDEGDRFGVPRRWPAELRADAPRPGLLDFSDLPY
jgi:Family of unknown function (DUF6421)